MGSLMKCPDCLEGFFHSMEEVKEDDKLVKLMCNNCGIAYTADINLEDEDEEV